MSALNLQFKDPMQTDDKPEPVIDKIDRRLILLTQSGLPLASRPYHSLATELGLSAKEVMQRLQAMLDSGVIRRIAAVPNHYALGYKANAMTVWDVTDDQVIALGQRIGELDFVSHAYRRPRHLPDWPYNLFAMVHGHTKKQVQPMIQQITKLLGDACQASDVLFSSQILKKKGLRLSPQVNKAL